MGTRQRWMRTIRAVLRQLCAHASGALSQASNSIRSDPRERSITRAFARAHYLLCLQKPAFPTVPRSCSRPATSPATET